METLQIQITVKYHNQLNKRSSILKNHRCELRIKTQCTMLFIVKCINKIKTSWIQVSLPDSNQ